MLVHKLAGHFKPVLGSAQGTMPAADDPTTHAWLSVDLRAGKPVGRSSSTSSDSTRLWQMSLYEITMLQLSIVTESTVWSDLSPEDATKCAVAFGPNLFHNLVHGPSIQIFI